LIREYFGFYSLGDVHHVDSLALIVHAIEGRWGRLYITNHILDETLTLLKYRISPETAKAFLDTFIETVLVQIIFSDRELENESLKIFRENITRKGLSYTDAVSVAVIRNVKLSRFLTYDLRSFQGLLNNIIGPNYWNTLDRREKEKYCYWQRNFSLNVLHYVINLLFNVKIGAKHC